MLGISVQLMKMTASHQTVSIQTNSVNRPPGLDPIIRPNNEIAAFLERAEPFRKLRTSGVKVGQERSMYKNKQGARHYLRTKYNVFKLLSIMHTNTLPLHLLNVCLNSLLSGHLAPLRFLQI